MDTDEMIKYMQDTLSEGEKWDDQFAIPTKEQIDEVALGRPYEPIPEELYCPVTFDEGVPLTLGMDHPVVRTGETLWMYCHDWRNSNYFKFTQVKELGGY